MNWSEEQKKVIETRDCDLLVSAAAGSGKTAVLVERIIRRITDPEDPVSLDELLVMTFTDAAAAEMRERVGKALSDRIRQEPDNSYLKLQKAILPRARISTIHSVCQGLIRQYYQELEIDPGFRVAEEGELRLLKEDVLQQLLEECYAEGRESYLTLSDNFNNKGMDGRVSVLIDKLASFVQSCEWPERYLAEQKEICGREAEGDYRELPWYKAAVQDIHSRANAYKELLEQALRICESPGGPAAYSDGILECFRYAEQLAGLDSYEEIRGFAANVSFGRLKGVKKELVDAGKAECVKGIRSDFGDYLKKELRDKLLILPPEQFLQSLAGSASLCRELTELAEEYLKRFAEAKRERNLVDFNDMEHFALQLLYRQTEDGPVPSPLADELASQFREIMIDEYQDSNGVQESLLYALSSERFGRPDVFMVGDVKQSIYRFRQAEPRLFIEKYHRYGETGDHRKIELNRNFRSRMEVLQSVNDIFERIMRDELGGVLYDDAARLYPGAVYPSYDRNKTELLVADTAGLSDQDPDAEELEYRMIARRILELTSDAGEAGRFLVTDKDSGQLRPVRYKDIAILMRAARGHAEKLTDILNSQGIPAYFHNSTGFFSSPEVEVMLAMLSIIDNPQQDEALTAVLRSPAGGFGDDELALIRADYDEDCRRQAVEPGSFYEAVIFAADSNEKVRGFLDRLEEWRELADIQPVHILLEQIYSETGYYDYVSASPRGSVRRRNLDMLLEKAEDYGTTNYRGLFNFSRYIEKLREYDTDHGEAAAFTENDDIVRIMTIHGSKGLEYPVVFLARIGSGKSRDDEEGIVLDRDLGLACDYIDREMGILYPSLKKQVLRSRRKREEKGEQLRLFYVAMTRAREKLIMTAALKDAGEKIPAKLEEYAPFYETAEHAGGPGGPVRFPAEMIGRCSSWLDLFLAAAAGGIHSTDIRILEPEALLAEDLMPEEEKEEFGNYLKELRKLCGSEEGPAGPGGMASPEGPAEDGARGYEEELSAMLKAVYPWQEETGLRPKISVSEIKMKSFEEQPSGAAGSAGAAEPRGTAGAPGAAASVGEAPDYDDAGLAEEQYFADIWQGSRMEVSQGALRGTAFHRFLELLPYKGSPEEQIAAVRSCGLISGESLELVDEQAVRTFLESGLGQRMQRAAEKGQLFREQHFMVGIPAGRLDPSRTTGELQLLQGIIDAYIEEPDHIVLIDYKTDHASQDEELIRHYRVQLELYADALTQLTGKPVTEKIIYSTSLQKEIQV